MGLELCLCRCMLMGFQSLSPSAVPPPPTDAPLCIWNKSRTHHGLPGPWPPGAALLCDPISSQLHSFVPVLGHAKTGTILKPLTLWSLLPGVPLPCDLSETLLSTPARLVPVLPLPGVIIPFPGRFSHAFCLCLLAVMSPPSLEADCLACLHM